MYDPALFGTANPTLGILLIYCIDDSKFIFPSFYIIMYPSSIAALVLYT